MLNAILKNLNIKSSKQNKIITEQVEKIEQIARKKKQEEESEEKNKKELEDNTCPNCKNTDKETIVDRIIVNIKSISSGYLFFGGSTPYSEQENIRHCNKCNNEWKEYKIDYWKKSTRYHQAKIMDSIALFLESDSKYFYGYAKLIKDFYAESIYRAYRDVEEDAYWVITLKKLRTKFKSIFDVKK